MTLSSRARPSRCRLDARLATSRHASWSSSQLSKPRRRRAWQPSSRRRRPTRKGNRAGRTRFPLVLRDGRRRRRPRDGREPRASAPLRRLRRRRPVPYSPSGSSSMSACGSSRSRWEPQTLRGRLEGLSSYGATRTISYRAWEATSGSASASSSSIASSGGSSSGAWA